MRILWQIEIALELDLPLLIVWLTRVYSRTCVSQGTLNIHSPAQTDASFVPVCATENYIWFYGCFIHLQNLSVWVTGCLSKTNLDQETIFTECSASVTCSVWLCSLSYVGLCAGWVGTTELRPFLPRITLCSWKVIATSSSVLTASRKCWPCWALAPFKIRRKAAILNNIQECLLCFFGVGL